MNNCRKIDCSRILVVEDEPDLRDTLRDLLELEGYRVSTAANGKEGLQVIEEVGEPCLILLDLMMPVMNGWEFMHALRTQPLAASNVPVVVVSAAADIADLPQRYGCAVLRKPVRIEQLLALAHAYCTGSAVEEA